MVSFGTLQTLLFTLGPLLGPRLYSYYNTQRAASASSPLPVIPTPRRMKYALNVLFLSALLFFISTLPIFSPENILAVTSSRLQIPPDVLFTRLASLRENRTLTPADELLRPRIASLDARCLYLTYGPDTIANCPFCTSDDPRSYLYYYLPVLLTPHLLHLLTLGLATSSAVAGKAGNRWRNYAAALAIGLAVADVYMVAAYDWKANARVLRPEGLTHFYWQMRTLRGLTLAVADVAFAGLLWLSGTNRMFGIPVSSAERVEGALKTLDQSRKNLAALTIVKNVVVRDEGLTVRSRDYWKREKLVMTQVMDEREVVEGVRSALENRVQMQELEAEAGRHAEGIASRIPAVEEGGWPACLGR